MKFTQLLPLTLFSLILVLSNDIILQKGTPLQKMVRSTCPFGTVCPPQ